ncbi:MAG TPA: DUF402 domain-containing protein [Gaiellaceae bacterium]|nr:DUF402 domain-containing protein [Gaiellaceae bacterium]
MQAGEIVLKRSIYRGNVRWVFPHRYVGEWDGRIALYCGPGNQGKAMRRGPDGYLKRWMTDKPPFDTEWESTHVLRFEREAARHSIDLYWTTGWEHMSWYVNLQTPTRIAGSRVDTTDQALDVLVFADGTWRWKDEDELEEAVELGIWTRAEADEIRAEGERVVAAAPWPTGFEDWRPPEGWGPLGLPRDWHVV